MADAEATVALGIYAEAEPFVIKNSEATCALGMFAEAVPAVTNYSAASVALGIFTNAVPNLIKNSEATLQVGIAPGIRYIIAPPDSVPASECQERVFEPLFAKRSCSTTPDEESLSFLEVINKGERCVCIPEETYGNVEQNYTAYCPVGSVGEPVTVTIPALSYFSNESQAAADALALAAATEQAEAGLDCVAFGVSWVSSLSRAISGSSSITPGSGSTAESSIDSTISQATTNSAGQLPPTPEYPTGPTPAAQVIVRYEITITSAELASVDVAVTMYSIGSSQWNRLCVGGGRVTLYAAHQINTNPGVFDYFFDQFSSGVISFEQENLLETVYTVPIVAGTGWLALEAKGYSQTPGYVLCPDFGSAEANTRIEWVAPPQ